MQHKFQLLFSLFLLITAGGYAQSLGANDALLNLTQNSSKKSLLFNSFYVNEPERYTRQETSGFGGWQLGININPGLLTNTFDDFVIGGNVSLQRQLTDVLTLTISTGLTHYIDQYYNLSLTVNGTGPATVHIIKTARNVIPFQAGGIINIAGGFHLAGEVGEGFGSNSVNSFLYTPSLGMSFKNGVGVGFKYDNYTSAQIRDVLSSKIEYRFKL